jgi:hypothetical protein
VAKRPTSPKDEDLAGPTDDAPGATAFVRLDDAGKLPPPRAPAPTSGAPKKGLQIQLPDDEPPPPPKKKVAPPVAKPKGRRGAWWDEQSAGAGDDEATAPGGPGEPPADEPPAEEPAQEEPAEPPADDAPGATAFLKVEAPPPPPRRKAPAPPAAAAPADDGRTQFFKPEQVVLQAEVRERPAPPKIESGVPWKQILLALLVAFLVTVLGLVVLFRKDLFDKPGTRPARHSTGSGGQPGE